MQLTLKAVITMITGTYYSRSYVIMHTCRENVKVHRLCDAFCCVALITVTPSFYTANYLHVPCFKARKQVTSGAVMSYFNVGHKLLWTWKTELFVHVTLFIVYGTALLARAPPVCRL